MSTFRSGSSKAQAQENVNKLLASFLPGSVTLSTQRPGTKKSTTSGAAIIDQKVKSIKDIHVNQELQRKALRKDKVAKRKKIQAQLAKNKELNKVVKINKLKNEKKYQDEELQNIINSKLTSLKSWENTRADELRSLEKEILLLSNQDAQRRTKVKAKNQKKMDFNRKLNRGIVAYPGLTPGLAPVDLTDGEDDSD